MPGAQLSRVRRARGRSRQSLADQATRLDPANPLTARAIELLETTDRVPAITGSLGRIDLALGLDGRLGVERTFDSRESSLGSTRTRYVVPYPRYWTGPVWLRADGPEGSATGAVDLRWGPWHRLQTVQSGVVLDFRRAPSAPTPLEADVPNRWRVTAGIGSWPDALDINRDWRPADMSAAIGLLRGALADIRAGQVGRGHQGPRHVRPSTRRCRNWTRRSYEQHEPSRDAHLGKPRLARIQATAGDIGRCDPLPA